MALLRLSMFPYRNKKGFTMTEVIIASLIIVVLAGGMFSSFWGAQHFLNRAKHRAQAFNFAMEALDRLRSNYKYSDSGMNVGAGHLEAEIGSILRGELSGLGATLTYDVTEPQVNGYKQVTVTVNWNEPSF